MGVYCTTTALATLMIGSTFDSNTTALAGKAIDHAEAEVNKYLSKRYDMTVYNTSTTVPPGVRALAEQLATGYTYKGMARGGTDAYTRADKYIKDAVENLKLYQEYKADLLNTAGSLIADKSTTSYRVLVNTETYTETFQEDSPLNWQVDPDKEEDIDSERG